MVVVGGFVLFPTVVGTRVGTSYLGGGWRWCGMERLVEVVVGLGEWKMLALEELGLGELETLEIGWRTSKSSVWTLNVGSWTSKQELKTRVLGSRMMYER